MSETQQNIRVRLGPVASALIEGSSENRQEALDRAILDLQERAAAGTEERLEQASGADPLQALEGKIEAQGALLSALRFSVMKEMQMIRLLIASLMSKSDSSQQQLLAFATEAVETLRRDTSLVLEKEHTNLANQEAVFQEAVRRDMQQGYDGLEREVDEELER
ncbi:MAG: hypothetical protein AB3N24_02640 [Leisingera sp.]